MGQSPPNTVCSPLESTPTVHRDSSPTPSVRSQCNKEPLPVYSRAVTPLRTPGKNDCGLSAKESCSPEKPFYKIHNTNLIKDVFCFTLAKQKLRDKYSNQF